MCLNIQDMTPAEQDAPVLDCDSSFDDMIATLDEFFNNISDEQLDEVAEDVLLDSLEVDVTPFDVQELYQKYSENVVENKMESHPQFCPFLMELKNVIIHEQMPNSHKAALIEHVFKVDADKLFCVDYSGETISQQRENFLLFIVQTLSSESELICKLIKDVNFPISSAIRTEAYENCDDDVFTAVLGSMIQWC